MRFEKWIENLRFNTSAPTKSYSRELSSVKKFSLRGDWFIVFGSPIFESRTGGPLEIKIAIPTVGIYTVEELK